MKKFIRKIREKVQSTGTRLANLMIDREGDLATNTIGAIIIAVVVVGLLIVAINNFFPSFFTSMFENMSDKLNANW